MGSKTDYLEDQVLDHIVNNLAYTQAAAVFSALFTVLPSDSTATGEVSGSSYTRVTTAFSTAGATVTGQVVNTAAVTFTTCSTTGYTVIGWGLYDAATSGNLLYWATVTTLAVGVGDQATFAVGNIVITED